MKKRTTIHKKELKEIKFIETKNQRTKSFSILYRRKSVGMHQTGNLYVAWVIFVFFPSYHTFDNYLNIQLRIFTFFHIRTVKVHIEFTELNHSIE